MHKLSEHIKRKAKELGIPLETIELVLKRPCKVMPSAMHPGQDRYTGYGIAIMVNSYSKVAITVYLDTVLTPLRPDQIKAGVKIERKIK